MTVVSYAQNQEDVLLWRALSNVKKGRYLDIGAQDPVHDSVSRLFYEQGWRGFHFEPTPHFATRLRENRPEETVVEAAVGSGTGPIRFYEILGTGLSTGVPEIARQHGMRDWPVTEIDVPLIPLSDAFDMMGDGEVHWLKIDVEGMEGSVLTSWGSHPCRPWIVCAESTRPSSQSETHHEWAHLLNDRGYREVFFDGLSRYWISADHQELAKAFESPVSVFDDFRYADTHWRMAQFRETYEKRLAAIQNERTADRKAHEKRLAALRKERAVESAQLEFAQTQLAAISEQYGDEALRLETKYQRAAANSAAELYELQYLVDRTQEQMRVLTRNHASAIEARDRTIQALRATVGSQES